MKITVIVPALNEEENISSAINDTLKAFADFNIDGEIIVINDGSTDRTEELVSKITQGEHRVRMLKHKKPLGIGASFWDSVDVAKGDAVCMLPGDNENEPAEILRYLVLLEHVDIVNPYVFNRQDRPLFRNFISYLFQFIINLTFLTSFKYTNGTVLYRKSLLKELNQRCMSFFFQTDILIRLVKKGYLFAEVPYRLRRREKGKSKAVNLRSLFAVIKGYTKLVWDIYFKRSERQKLFSSDSITQRRYQQLNKG